MCMANQIQEELAKWPTISNFNTIFLKQASSGESRQSAKLEIYLRGLSHMTTSLLCPGLLRRCMVTDLTGMRGMRARPYIV